MGGGNGDENRGLVRGLENRGRSPVFGVWKVGVDLENLAWKIGVLSGKLGVDREPVKSGVDRGPGKFGLVRGQQNRGSIQGLESGFKGREYGK